MTNTKQLLSCVAAVMWIAVGVVGCSDRAQAPTAAETVVLSAADIDAIAAAAGAMHNEELREITLHAQSGPALLAAHDVYLERASRQTTWADRILAQAYMTNRPGVEAANAPEVSLLIVPPEDLPPVEGLDPNYSTAVNLMIQAAQYFGERAASGDTLDWPAVRLYLKRRAARLPRDYNLLVSTYLSVQDSSTAFWRDNVSRVLDSLGVGTLGASAVSSGSRTVGTFGGAVRPSRWAPFDWTAHNALIAAAFANDGGGTGGGPGKPPRFPTLGSAASDLGRSDAAGVINFGIAGIVACMTTPLTAPKCIAVGTAGGAAGGSANRAIEVSSFRCTFEWYNYPAQCPNGPRYGG